jgi:two-component system, NtrC family, sensor kinase
MNGPSDQHHAAALHTQKLESIGQLAAGIAHEINTPIQYVGDNTRFLKKSFTRLVEVVQSFESVVRAAQQGPVEAARVEEALAVAKRCKLEYLSAEIPKAIEQSLEGIDRVAGIVRAMKEFSHPDRTQSVPTDLNKCIETTITVARNEWKYVAEMAPELDRSLPLVSCIPGDFNQVVLNMIVNAAHAISDRVGDGSQGKGTITISTRTDGDDVEIRIGDTGTGIPESCRRKIFDPFFTTKEVGKGTGQGLAIAYSVIVKKHGGTITFETEENVGTTFIIRLPINGANTEEGESSRAPAALVCG